MPNNVTSLEAVIFDMDGILIDSEPFWQISEKAVFAEIGFEMTHDMCLQTTGLRCNEVVDYWYLRHPWDLARRSRKDIENGIIDGLIALVKRQGKLMPGVREALDFCRRKGLKIGLATSSDYRIIDAVLSTLDLRDAFEVTHSAQEEPFGKPHPAVYLSAARLMGVNPLFTVAIEDSLNGLISARAARMHCIAVPAPASFSDPRFSIADVCLPSLSALDEKSWAPLETV